MTSAEETAKPSEGTDPKRIMLVSRCAWTMYNFRRHLIRNLLKQNKDVIALAAGGDGYEERVSSLGVRYEPIPLEIRGVRVGPDIRLFIHFVRRFRALKPQVVHLFTIKPAIFGTLAAAVAGVPVRVVMITGVGFVFTSARWPLRMVVTLLYGLALRFAHRVYFQNPNDRDEFLRRRLVSASKVRMIAGSGVDLDVYAPARKSVGPVLTFVMVARLLREKGVEEFFIAAEIVHGQAPHVRFVLVGGTDLRNPTSLSDDEAQQSASHAGVTWVGQVDDVRPYINEADVVVLPSYREGTPMSLLEAAAMAKPIIATDVPGCREVVQDGVNGLLVAVRDGKALAEAMMKCVRDPSILAPMGDAGRALVAKRYDVRLVSEQILSDYDILWKQRNRP